MMMSYFFNKKPKRQPLYVIIFCSSSTRTTPTHPRVSIYMSSPLQYNILVFNSPPHSATNVTPVASLLASDAAKFVSVTHYDVPTPPESCATGLGSNCGRRGCVECPPSTVRAASADYEIFKTALAKYLTDTARGIVILRSTTVTTATSAFAFSDALDVAETAVGTTQLDLFFFARWLDRPELYDVLHEFPDNGMKVIRTYDAHGIQALAITPGGMEKLKAGYSPDTNPVFCRPFAQVINTLLRTGGLYGAATTPSLASYDATLILAGGAPPADPDVAPESRQSYLKLAEARGSTFPERPFNRRVSGDLGIFWTVIVIVVVLLTAWIIVKIGLR